MKQYIVSYKPLYAKFRYNIPEVIKAAGPKEACEQVRLRAIEFGSFSHDNLKAKLYKP